jgi:hypothetical protein
MQRIALVYLNDGNNFFIENPPKGTLPDLIGSNTPKMNGTISLDDVEYITVFEVGKVMQHWANPDSSSAEG